MRVAEIQSDLTRVKADRKTIADAKKVIDDAEAKAAAAKMVEEQAARDALEEQAARDALLAQVTQIDPADDMMVTPARDSDGDLKGVMVGETGISTIRHDQQKRTLEVEGVRAGIRSANGGIEILHAAAYVGMRSALGAKVLPGGLNADTVIDNIWVVETLDEDDIDPESDKIDLPRNAFMVDTEIDGTSNAMPQFAEGGTLASLSFVLEDTEDALAVAVTISRTD